MSLTTPAIALALETRARNQLLPEQRELAERTVAVLRALPGIRSDLGDQRYLESLAWLHVVRESTDGALDGLVISNAEAEGPLPAHLWMGARLLHRESWMTDAWFGRQLDGAPELVRIVYVSVEIARLEGMGTVPAMERRRHTTRVEHWVAPIADGLGEPWRGWLVVRLEAALVECRAV